MAVETIALMVVLRFEMTGTLHATVGGMTGLAMHMYHRPQQQRQIGHQKHNCRNMRTFIHYFIEILSDKNTHLFPFARKKRNERQLFSRTAHTFSHFGPLP